MDQNDRHAIETLFGKLSQVERQAPPRDAEAERFIGDQIARQPGAPYFMAQTIVVQEQALNAAQARIEQLEQQAQQGGGFPSRMFGGGAPAAQARPQPAPAYGGAQGGPFQSGGRPMPGQGGGFLAGAAQTAMGVAGGVLLGNAVMGMFGGEANAAEPAPAEDEEEPQEEEDAGFDDGGEW